MSRTKRKIPRRRPRCREECRNGPRPCPWVSCRYNLFLEVSAETGNIKFNYPGREIWELEQSCSLDLAEQGASTFEQIGTIFNLTRERIRQITGEILDRMAADIFRGSTREEMWPLPRLPSDAKTQNHEIG